MTIELEVPDDLYRRLEARATAANTTIAGFMIAHLQKITSMPTREELIERLRNLPSVQTTRDPVDVIRDVRDGGRSGSL